MLDMGVDVVCVMWEEHKSSELYFSIIELIFKKSVQCNSVQGAMKCVIYVHCLFCVVQQCDQCAKCSVGVEWGHFITVISSQ